MPDHKTILNAETHEPKHITSGQTSDTGKVITPSALVTGVSELRLLTADEIDNKLVALNTTIPDVSTIGSSGWVAAPTTGNIISVNVVVLDPITLADSILTVRVGGIAATLDTTLRIEFADSAAGDTTSANVLSGGTVNAGDAIQISSDGVSTGVASAQVTFLIRES